MADTNTDSSTSTEGAIPTINTLDNRQFHRFDITIGELPTSYLDSMTYYEMLAWFCNYLHKVVVPKINELTGGVNKLSQYVEEYIQKVEQLYKDWDAYQKDLNQQWADYKTDLNKQWADYKTDLTNQWNTYKTNLNKEWADYKTKFETAYKEFTDNINNEITQLKSEWATYKTDTTKQITDAISDMESKFSTLQTALEARVTTLEKDADDRISAKEKEVDDFLANIDVSQDVSDKIDAMVTDGTLNKVLQEAVPPLIGDATVSFTGFNAANSPVEYSFTTNQMESKSFTPTWGTTNLASSSVTVAKIADYALSSINKIDGDIRGVVFKSSLTAKDYLGHYSLANESFNSDEVPTSGYAQYIGGKGWRKGSSTLTQCRLDYNVVSGMFYLLDVTGARMRGFKLFYQADVTLPAQDASVAESALVIPVIDDWQSTQETYGTDAWTEYLYAHGTNTMSSNGLIRQSLNFYAPEGESYQNLEICVPRRYISDFDQSKFTKVFFKVEANRMGHFDAQETVPEGWLLETETIYTNAYESNLPNESRYEYIEKSTFVIKGNTRLPQIRFINLTSDTVQKCSSALDIDYEYTHTMG